MRTVEIKVYQASELSPEAFAFAHRAYEEGYEFFGDRDALLSLRRLAAWFAARLTNYSISWSNSQPSTFTFEVPDEPFSRGELRKLIADLGKYNRKTGKGLGECVLTGVCYDEDAIDGLRIAWRKGERDLESLLQAAAKSLLEACQSEYAHDVSEEGFRDFCEANDVEFLETGRRYHSRPDEKSNTTPAKLYLLRLAGGVEATVWGPFAKEGDRWDATGEAVEDLDADADALVKINILPDGKMEADAYSMSERQELLSGGDDEDEEED